MIPDNHAKSYLNESYVNAVATQAGFGCQFTRRDYGTDAVISEVQVTKAGQYVTTGYHFVVQMKATHNFKTKQDCIVYELDADAYNRLVYHKGSAIYLVVFCLPKSHADWISLTEDCLQLRKCCYYFPAPARLTQNSRSETIEIPRSNIFDPRACEILMELVKFSRGAT